MKKRICSLMLAGIMILTIPASATECIEAANTENTKEVVLGTVVTKEFDAFQQLANNPTKKTCLITCFSKSTDLLNKKGVAGGHSTSRRPHTVLHEGVTQCFLTSSQSTA